MSEENIEIVRGIYGLVSEIDQRAVLEAPEAERRALFEQAFHPDLEIRLLPGISGLAGTGGTFHGYEGFLEASRELIEDIEDIKWDPGGRRLTNGDTVVIEVTAFATGRGSGARSKIQFADLWTLEGGRVRRWMSYETFEEARKAAGLSE
jgi:ketosteroid isomerase-like protein